MNNENYRRERQISDKRKRGSDRNLEEKDKLVFFIWTQFKVIWFLRFFKYDVQWEEKQKQETNFCFALIQKKKGHVMQGDQISEF